MQYLVSDREMKNLDRNTSEHFHVPEIVLMEQAANAFIKEFARFRNDAANILIVCGTGNNGADGIAIARLLRQQNLSAAVCIPFMQTKQTDSFRLQYQIYTEYGYPVVSYDQSWESYTVLIDAMFGIGLSREIEGSMAECIRRMDNFHGTVFAVDMPSGVSAGTGQILGTGVHADHTITFSFGKTGQFLWPGSEYCGDVIIAPMGITKESWLDERPLIAALEPEDLSLLPERSAHSNKGTYGKVLVIAGSYNMAGAAYLCAKAAYRTGSGLVRIFTDDTNRIPLQSLIPEAILSTYDASFDPEMLLHELKWADAVILGPGIGTSETSHLIVKTVLQNIQIPCVIDADALNIISADRSLFSFLNETMIVTPHLGEMARLCKCDVKTIQGDLIATARTFSDTYHATCILKDCRSVINVWHGMTYLNLSGNHGMATAGSGDVLSGIVGSLLGQGCTVENAAVFGAYIHGLAGNQALQETGFRGMIADDIINGLNGLWKRES